MIIQQNFINKLKDFGLNSYEAKLWTALLSRGVSTAGELSDIANVPRSRSYDVLESLEKKGFVVMKLGKPIKYLAISPEDAIVRVKKRIKEAADVQTKILDDAGSGEIIGELKDLYSQGVDLINPEDLAGSLRGRDNLHSYLGSMIKNAEKSILISTTEDGVAKDLSVLIPLLEKARKKGVKIKISAPPTKSNKEYFTSLSKIAEVKHGNGNSRFFIVDGKELVFSLLGDKVTSPANEAGVWIKTSFFASAIESMFNSAWKSLGPVK